MTADNDAYNKDELEAPDWLNKQFLQDVLIKHLKEPTLKVTEAKMSPASGKGDHFASVMFRASVEYSIHEKKCSKSLIIKTLPEVEGFKMEFIGDSKIFQTEIAMYSQVIPKFEQILREAGKEITFGAVCVYYSLEPRKVMIFEDLVVQGYEIIRNRNMTMDELRSAFEKLAKWHAVSYKLLQEQPELFDELKYDLSTLPDFLEQDIMKSALPDFINALGKIESLKDYRKYFEPMRGKILINWQNVLREHRENRQKNAYYVLCHGDFHLKNMMFKGNDCMLLDFQMCNVGRMPNDIQYAKYMLLAADERREHCDELIYHYFDTFAKTLTKIVFKGKQPNLVEFRRQMFDRRDTDFMLISNFLAASYTMRQGKDLAEILENPDRRSEMYANKEYQKELEYLLPRMLHLGYFEPCEK